MKPSVSHQKDQITKGSLKIGHHPVQPDLVKFCHFGEILKVFGNFIDLFSIWQTYLVVGERNFENNLFHWAFLLLF